MDRAVVVRYRTTGEAAAAQNQALIEQVFAELAAADPGGLRYSAYRLEDGVSFVHVAVFESEANPLAGLAAFADFARDIAGRVDAPPVQSTATRIGAYRS